METDDQKIDKYVPKDDFVSRSYQTEIFELAVKENVIIFLPTGSGKTFIATLLIKHYCTSPKLHLPIKQGGHRCFFLVNTVALVEQQGKHIKGNTTYPVGEYSGDMGVDLWTKDTWIEQFEANRIFVMTCQIFLDLILSNTIGLKNVNLLIFDECHRGVSNHPMRQVMQNFNGVPPADQPRIIGLTATLLNGNIKPPNVKEEIRNLERTFMAKIATSLDEEMVQRYSTNPKECKISYSPNSKSDFCYSMLKKVLEECKEFVANVQIEDLEPPERNKYKMEQIDDGWKKANKRLKNLIEDIEFAMEDLGVFGGSMSLLAHLIQLYQLLPNAQVNDGRLVFQSIATTCTLLRKIFQDEMLRQGLSETSVLEKYSSDKVNKLMKILENRKADDAIIVFVKRRFMAKVLYYVMRKASSVNPKLSHVKSNFVVGYNVGNPMKDTRENYMQRKQNKKVMDLFNENKLNVLFASNVVEEGIDIRQCNFVIMFDLPMDFRSYVQSKGRARDAESTYILMTCLTDDSYGGKIEGFRAVEMILKEILYGGKSRLRKAPTKEELDASLFAQIPGLEPYRPYGMCGPVITALSAIQVVNRYYLSLKKDKFTKISPKMYLEKMPDGPGITSSKFKCHLDLPFECKIYNTIEGKWQDNVDNAKRSVALEACKLLHQAGELDDSKLLPKELKLMVVNNNFCPNMDASFVFTEKRLEKEVPIGTKKNKRAKEKKWADCLMDCSPEPNQPAFVHVLLMKPASSYTVPDGNNRLAQIYNSLTGPHTFAIVSSKRLPELAAFPLYMSSGELEGRVGAVNKVQLTSDQLKELRIFHWRLFDKLLVVAKPYLMQDLTRGQNTFVVAPVIVDNNNVNIDWPAINEIKNPFLPVEKPAENIRSLTFSDENYLNRVVSPWYRDDNQKKYIVTKICRDMTEYSRFQKGDSVTYKEYFENKYGVQLQANNQPLLEVRALGKGINFTKPRSLTKDLNSKDAEHKELFLPELCVVFPVSSHYWLRAQLLPSVLHRITQLCQAEHLRVCISLATSISSPHLPPEIEWEKLKEDVSIRQKPHQQENKLNIVPVMKAPKIESLKVLEPWGDEEEPPDIERNDESTLDDIINYSRFVKKPLLGKPTESTLQSSGLQRKVSNMTTVERNPLIVIEEPPPLSMLLNSNDTHSPQQVEIMQALTAAAANDIVNCERLETLGDAFLKFTISLTLFETQPERTEGELTQLKGIIVGNKNLFFCGQKKDLGSYLDVTRFAPKEDWVPPGFTVDRRIKEVINDTNLNPECLSTISIPENERAAGRLGSDTFGAIGDILKNVDCIEQNFNIPCLNVQALTDKNISDCVEAILGTYLKSCGVYGALAVMNWFGVIDTSLSKQEVFERLPTSPAKGKGDARSILQDPDYLQQILNYRFRDLNFLLQAVTHSSFTRNHITTSYQRLEFLGDAILDFLMTVHIFEKCDGLSPGDLTDLRSALVNNVTLAALVVRNNLHKFLLYGSPVLGEAMMRFASHQQKRNHVIDDDILFLMEENDVNMAESIDVPKALGDILEALIGAIYLDSGKDLNIVWKIIYNLMKVEIDKFHKKVPKNHVRMLYESNCGPKFKHVVQNDGVIMVSVEVAINGELQYFNGFGDNRREGKRAAAKHALRALKGITNHP